MPRSVPIGSIYKKFFSAVFMAVLSYAIMIKGGRTFYAEK